MTARALVSASLMALPALGAAQVAVGDSLWQRGNIAEATIAYQRAIESDRHSVRANILVARTLAWSHNFDSALVLLRNARIRVPDDPDVRYTEALYLSWSKRFGEAIVRYDSLLSSQPELDYVRVARARTLSWSGRLDEAARDYKQIIALPMKDGDAMRDAEVGLAQVTAWRGDLPAAAARFVALIANDSTDQRALLGLSGVRTWQGRPRAAVSLLERAVQRDSADLEARSMLTAARAAARPRGDVDINWSDDSDGDQNAWAVATQRVFLQEWVSLSATLGSLRARDAVRNASRALGELTLTAIGDRTTVSGSLGARSLDAGTPGLSSRSVLTARATATLRLPAASSLTVSVARLPFDEVAGVIARRIDLTTLDASLDLTPRRGMTVGMSGGTLDFSDANRRETAVLHVSQHWTDRPWIGAFARMTRFDRKSPAYFSPRQFSLFELQGGWEQELKEWSGSIGGGLGTQRVDPSKPWQNAYHVEGRFGRRWTNGNAVALSLGISTSAASSAVGAYRYRTAGLSSSLAW